jgi:uncharacterized protein YbjT (DUF2867 family)
MSSSRKVLVTGATGKQGGGVAHLLLQRGHKVRALTRNADSSAAQSLAAAGAEIRVGNLEERGSVDRALAGVEAVFAMSTPYEAGTQAETRQGLTLADAAKAAGVFLVYSSVGSANRQTGIPHFESKHATEKHILQIGARATILGPVYFMENATVFTRPQLKDRVYATPLTATRKLAQVAVADIAAAAVAVIESPDAYVGKRCDLAGDEVTGNEAVDILSRVTGQKFKYFQVPMEIGAQTMGDDLLKMYAWFERVGYAVDRASQKRDFPGLEWRSFEAWAREQDWSAIFA